MDTITDHAGKLAFNEFTDVELIDFGQYHQRGMHVRVELGPNVFPLEGHGSAPLRGKLGVGQNVEQRLPSGVPRPTGIGHAVPSDIGSKLFASDGAFCRALDGWAALVRDTALTCAPLGDQLAGATKGRGERCGRSTLGEIGVEFHAAYLSDTLRTVNSGLLRHGRSASLFNAPMKTIEEIRRERLLELIDEVGSIAALNAALGLLPRDSTLSQIKNQSKESKTTKPRGMGSTMARKLEEALKKPRGWMDSDPELVRRLTVLEWDVDMERKAASPLASSEPSPAPYRDGPPATPPKDFHDPRKASEDDWQMLEDLRWLPSPEQAAIRADIHERSAKHRAHVMETIARINKEKGTT